jgi:hypothetical protein
MLEGRLAELADQATEYCKTQPREITGSMWEKKFAELIIKECIEQVELELETRGQLLSGGPPTNAGVYYACANIRRHFGVK